MTVVGRYAPSPTGRLHLGNARTALLAWLQVRAARGRFVLRVEDLDPQRSRPEHEARQLDELRWLGLDWDEGPDVGGPNGPYRQSERGEVYAAALARLDTFACTCTRKELREVASAPHGADPIYPGTCRVAPSHPGRPAALRWRVPPGEVCFDDGIAGRWCQDVAAEVGEFVLRRADGAWAYQLAVVVDDAAMGVTHVLRGADLIDSTPRQILLARSLGLTAPSFAHAPLILGADGNKLNKRHGAPDLSALRAAGVDPRRVVAALARSAGLLNPADQHEHVAPHELIASFDLRQVGRDPGPLVELTPLA
ncbi:glutamyl-Q-tRNA synthetase [Enhygromyxa salina]|uniref:Glutamyl-Q tRNA(Asp) synthetase n=1 Tax=Enhygromyxa salina TaxID=215803 RepID=A0A0C1ZUT5_9BACT|nr:tRNA glutamyl-Q(34) synthetase GluQRS [Enhygromyxa salina]KIG14813.1 glutamyl-Q-tRNA synthetase [Enhygromyxa salina]